MSSIIRTSTLLAAAGLVVSTALAQPINEDSKIMAGDGAADDEFGYAVAIDQGVIAVGARNDDDNGADSGSAYLYNASTGAQIAKLLPADGVAGDQFGYSIAISGGVVAVGAPGSDGAGMNSGAVYVFNASTGAQIAKLTADDAGAGDEFGNAVDIDSGVVAIGAWRADEFGDGSGAAYLFDASSGSQMDKLLPDAGANFQTFGVSIAIEGDTVAVGARTFFVLGDGFTFARVHMFDASTGNQTGLLRPDIENYNGDQGGHFGDVIDISNGVVAVGAPNRSVFFDFSGAAYVFDAATGDQLHFIFPADGHDRDHFGRSVSIDEGVLAIGASEDDDAAWAAGSAYLYDADSGSQIDKLLASDGAEFDLFGSSVAIDNGVVAVGATGFSDSSFAGALYVFGEGVAPCPADLTEDGVLDLADVQAFIACFTTQDPLADLNGDGIHDLSDVQLFATSFLAGCP